jgi:ubiquinone biosynthesis protein
MAALRPRHLRRYRQIAEVLTRHGFGAVVAQLGLDVYLNLPRRMLRRRPVLAAEMTPAKHLVLAMEELGPTFIKLGQILSTRSDLLPPSFIAELSRLQDDVIPIPWASTKATLEQELGAPIEELFMTFETTPLASASLGQVHAATLPNGDEVVVKVQRPEVEQIIDLDLDILYDLAHLAQERTPLGNNYDLVELTEEFSASLRGELDYRREGRNADRFRTNFADEPHLYVPRIYWDYTTRRVMAQERIGGIKIDDIAALEAAGYDRHQRCLKMVFSTPTRTPVTLWSCQVRSSA